MEKTAFQHGFEKRAILKPLLSGAWGIAKRVAKNPLKTLGAASTIAYAGAELGSSINKGSQAAARQTLGDFARPVSGATF